MDFPYKSPKQNKLKSASVFVVLVWTGAQGGAAWYHYSHNTSF